MKQRETNRIRKFQQVAEPLFPGQTAPQLKYVNVMKKALVIAALVAVGAWSTTYAADVKENYEKTCQKCHGPDGKAQTKMGQKAGAKDFTDAKVKAEITDEKAFKAIKEGIKDGEKTKMK